MLYFSKLQREEESYDWINTAQYKDILLIVLVNKTMMF